MRPVIRRFLRFKAVSMQRRATSAGPRGATLLSHTSGRAKARSSNHVQSLMWQTLKSPATAGTDTETGEFGPGAYHDPQSRRRGEDAPARAGCATSSFDGGRGAPHPGRRGGVQGGYAEPCEHRAGISGRTTAWTWRCRLAGMAANRRLSTEPPAMSVLLDTNVVSELLRKVPDPAVETWAAGHALEELFFSAVGEAELRYGAALLPTGRRRDALALAIDGILREDFEGRILPFDSRAARAPVRRSCSPMAGCGLRGAARAPVRRSWPAHPGTRAFGNGCPGFVKGARG